MSKAKGKKMKYRVVSAEPVDDRRIKLTLVPVELNAIELVFGKRRLARLRRKPKKLKEVLRNALKGKLRKTLEIQGSGTIRDSRVQKGTLEDSTRPVDSQVKLSDGRRHRDAGGGRTARSK